MCLFCKCCESIKLAASCNKMADSDWLKEVSSALFLFDVLSSVLLSPSAVGPGSGENHHGIQISHRPRQHHPVSPQRVPAGLRKLRQVRRRRPSAYRRSSLELKEQLMSEISVCDSLWLVRFFCLCISKMTQSPRVMKLRGWARMSALCAANILFWCWVWLFVVFFFKKFNISFKFLNSFTFFHIHVLCPLQFLYMCH